MNLWHNRENHYKFPLLQGFTVVIVADSVPELNQTLSLVSLSQSATLMVQRFVIAFVLHFGRMSCLATAEIIRSESRNRAQTARFLTQGRWKKAGLNEAIRTWPSSWNDRAEWNESKNCSTEASPKTTVCRCETISNQN